MQKQEDKEKIERYIEGQADAGESDWLDNMFITGDNNDTLRHSLKKDWERMVSSDLSSGPDLNYILDRVHHKIRKNENLKRQKPLRKFVRIYMKAAAILLLPMLIAAMGYKFLENRPADDQPVSSTIYAPMGARISFNLPDGTTGMLNSGSSLSYSLPFNIKRKVNLNGEAWFDVYHDPKHPFEITSGTSTVKVFGTRFNINAYPDESYVEVVLEEGKVSYRNQEVSEEVAMLPSERLIFKDGNIIKSVTDPAKYNAWTEGKLVFRGDPMAEVARRLERWYNVKVQLADKALNKYSFRGIFLDDTLEDVLKFLSMTSPIRYSISPRQMMHDGTYKKAEVTIYLK